MRGVVQMQGIVKQRADMTFKYNLEHGRHGWLRLTPAYSVKLVEDILAAAEPGIRVLDPFSGTGTTALCAAYRNDEAVGVEINPFLAWLAKAKLDTYPRSTVIDVRDTAIELAEAIRSGHVSPSPPPRIYDIDRWWNEKELDFLCVLKSAIENRFSVPSRARNLLLIGFCRLVIKLSNAAFNHQSMSFKMGDNGQKELFTTTPDFGRHFLDEMESVLSAAENNPSGVGRIVQGDSRNVASCVTGKFDLLITSPPYPNRISYIRELRPYMYWLGYLTDARTAGELDWQAIGGTWGIATSRLNEWQPSADGFRPQYFEKILAEIAGGDNKNGPLLSNYVAKYFEDMWRHIKSVAGILSKGTRVHYIVGNSTFYDVLLPVEILYKDMLQEAGFHDVKVQTIRKRNSKKALFEYDVSSTRR